MARLNREQLNIIKEKMGVDQLFSFSKISTYGQCSHLYRLKYVDKIRVKGDSCYTHFGTMCHEIIQDYYEGKYEYDQMIKEFDRRVMEWKLEDDPALQFGTESERDKYIANVGHYFENVATVKTKVEIENPVLTELFGRNKYVTQGYIDGEYIEDGKLVILDFKTSTITGFSGAKLAEKSRQLMLYALGVVQHGRIIDGEKRQFAVEDIKLRYDMQKYMKVKYMLANGKEKETTTERSLWVAKIANQIRKDFDSVPKEIEKLEKKIVSLTKKRNAKVRTEEEKVVLGEEIDDIQAQLVELNKNVYDILEINEMLDYAINNNTLALLPEFIQGRYELSDCHIDIELTQETMDEFVQSLTAELDEITAKEEENDPDKAFVRDRIADSESFFCTKLCEMREQCKYYKDYQENNSMFQNQKQDEQTDDEILKMLGLL